MSRQPSPSPNHPSHLQNNNTNMYQPPVTAPSSSKQSRQKNYPPGITAGAEDIKYQTKYRELKKKVKEIEFVGHLLSLCPRIPFQYIPLPVYPPSKTSQSGQRQALLEAIVGKEKYTSHEPRKSVSPLQHTYMDLTTLDNLISADTSVQHSIRTSRPSATHPRKAPPRFTPRTRPCFRSTPASTTRTPGVQGT